MIIHLTTWENFTKSYIDFINSNFNPESHMFYIFNKSLDTTSFRNSNVKILELNTRSLLIYIYNLFKAKKIIIHGLSSQSVLSLYLQPWLLKKSYWIIWGFDLYYYRTRNKKIKSNFYEKMRRFVIKNIQGLVTHIKGDFELVKKWYGARGTYHYSFVYPSNLYRDSKVILDYEPNNITNILLGNSADPSNNHREILEKLHGYEQNIKIICPLSYGNQEYSKDIICLGKELFGKKFIPLTNFLEIEEYTSILNKIDVAIFNHNRQQAIGNINTLLGLGKKVYIRDNITTWNYCLEHKLKVYSISKDFDDIFVKLDRHTKNVNISNVKLNFSEKKLINDLRSLFQ